MLKPLGVVGIESPQAKWVRERLLDDTSREGDYLVVDFQRLGCVAIGWREVGDLTRLTTTLDDIRAAVGKAYPDAQPGNGIISGSTLHKF